MREDFYKNMVWIVDGTRLKRDYPRFLKGKKNSYENPIFYKTDNPKIFRVDLVDWCFPSNWVQSSVPVIFDYFGDGSLEDSDGLRNNLFCLFPQIGRFTIVAEFSRKAFINGTTNGQWTLKVQGLLNGLIEQNKLQAQKEKIELEIRQARNTSEFNRWFFGKKSKKRRRRF